MRAERVAAGVRHVPERIAEVRARYIQELAARVDRVDEFAAAGARGGRVTILYAVRDPEHNGAVVVGELVRDG